MPFFKPLSGAPLKKAFPKDTPSNYLSPRYASEHVSGAFLQDVLLEAFLSGTSSRRFLQDISHDAFFKMLPSLSTNLLNIDTRKLCLFIYPKRVLAALNRYPTFLYPTLQVKTSSKKHERRRRKDTSKPVQGHLFKTCF